jgi:hypothetical protein
VLCSFPRPTGSSHCHSLGLGFDFPRRQPAQPFCGRIGRVHVNRDAGAAVGIARTLLRTRHVTHRLTIPARTDAPGGFLYCQSFRGAALRRSIGPLANSQHETRLSAVSTSKHSGARANDVSMRVNRWRVAVLSASRSWVRPPGRTRIAARWTSSNRNVWKVEHRMCARSRAWLGAGVDLKCGQKVAGPGDQLLPRAVGGVGAGGQAARPCGTAASEVGLAGERFLGFLCLSV